MRGDKKPGLAIMIGAPRGGRRGGEAAEDDEYGEDPMGEESMSACDMALEDAFRAVKAGDSMAFKDAMRDAIGSYSSRE